MTVETSRENFTSGCFVEETVGSSRAARAVKQTNVRITESVHDNLGANQVMLLNFTIGVIEIQWSEWSRTSHSLISAKSVDAGGEDLLVLFLLNCFLSFNLLVLITFYCYAPYGNSIYRYIVQTLSSDWQTKSVDKNGTA